MKRWLAFFGLAPLYQVKALEHDIEQFKGMVDRLDYDLRAMESRLIESRIAFAHQSMAFSRRYEALERSVLDVAALQPRPPFIIKKETQK